MRIAICDDDINYVEKCRQWLCELSDEYDIPVSIVHYENGQQLMFDLEDNTAGIDLVYLDVVMPKMDGIKTAGKIREIGANTEIVFFTNSQHDWDKAFDFDAANYLIKESVTQERFSRVFLSVAKKIRNKNSESILLSCAGERRRIPIQDITYFEVRKNIITVHYGAGQDFDFYSPIGKIEEELSDKNFIRCHRAFLVSGSQIKKIEGQDIELFNGELVPMSRNARKVVQDFLAQKV